MTPRTKSTGRLLAALSVTTLLASMLLAGCNTTEGFGKDVKSGGGAIEDAAKDAKK